MRSTVLAGAPALFCLLTAAQDAPFAALERGRVTIFEGEASRAVPGLEDVSTFSWDAGGEHLLVTRGGRLERVAIADGSAATIADGWQALRFPDAAPDGSAIVCAATEVGAGANEWNVVWFDARGGEPRVLSDGYDPCFSRDGREVWFERYPDRDLWVCATDGSGLRKAFEDASDRYTVQLDPYAPRVAYSSRGRLVLRDLESGAEHSFSPEGAYDRFASFSPDRRSLLFFRQLEREGAAPTAIWERDLDANREHVLFEGGGELASYRPTSLAGFAERSRRSREARTDGSWLAIDAQRDPILRRWIEREAREWAGGHLYLFGIAELAPCEAATLARHRGHAIFLPDLKRLDASTARFLARFNGSLFLDGIAELDVEAARELATWRGNAEQCFLSLDGLREPSLETLRALSKCRGWGLSLDGIGELSAAACAALGPVHVASLDLDGVQRIERDAAEAISKWTAKFVSLRGWSERDAECEALVRKGCAELLTK